MIIRLNEEVQVLPENPTSNLDVTKIKAKIVYIHPLARFYTIQFTFPAGSFCECRLFTESELEKARRTGYLREIKKQGSKKKVPSPAARIENFTMVEDLEAAEKAQMSHHGHNMFQNEKSETAEDVNLMF